MNYYTYAYLREDRTPYYIGKGKGKRIYSKQRRVKPPKDKSRIIFLKQNLTEEEAFKHEIYMIAVFGRKDNGTGILRNVTDGGEGTTNLFTLERRMEIGKKISANISREKLSESMKKAKANMTPEQKMEVSRKRVATILRTTTPEQRSEISRRASMGTTLEQKRRAARIARETYLGTTTHEERSERAKERGLRRSPEEMKRIRDIYYANSTPEQRSERGRKTQSQRWQCTETGYVHNPASLSHYQRARGIDTSKRIRLS